MKKSVADHQREDPGPHLSSQLLLLRVWIERSYDRHTPEELAGKLQDPISGQVQYFRRAMELVQILHRMLSQKEERGPAQEADDAKPDAATPQART